MYVTTIRDDDVDEMEKLRSKGYIPFAAVMDSMGHFWYSLYKPEPRKNKPRKTKTP